MHPRSIAWVGASNNPAKMGTVQLLNLLRGGFSGPVYPIHPTEKTVLGLKAYPNASALPEVPDLAVLVVPTRVASQVLDDLGRRGVRRAVITTAGFKEVGGEGQRREAELVEVARRWDMRFLGPNCIGVMAPGMGLNTTFFPLTGEAGTVGLASQSGTFVTQVLLYLERRGIRFSQAISVGNEATIDVVDCLEYLGGEEDTRAVLLYLEVLRRPQAFLEVARRVAQQKPVVALYVGGTEAGGRAGASHTGAMAGNDRLYDALFRQAGVVRAETVEDLYTLGFVLGSQPPLRGRRIGIVSHSGGPVTSMADACERYGLEVPVFSEKLQEILRPMLPATASAVNPVDLTFSMEPGKMATVIPRAIFESGEVDGILIHGLMGSSFREIFAAHLEGLAGISLEEMEKAQREALRKAMRELAGLPAEYGKPVICSSFMDRDQDDCTRYLQDHGIPVLSTPDKAVRMMAGLGRYAAVRRRWDG